MLWKLLCYYNWTELIQELNFSKLLLLNAINNTLEVKTFQKIYVKNILHNFLKSKEMKLNNC